ncbi:MAG: hypothetical protein SFU56_00270 [Capsulimonadales bacterium]|nr:hypothetical protein [Capsulimonadales bacterium]
MPFRIDSGRMRWLPEAALVTVSIAVTVSLVAGCGGSSGSSSAPTVSGTERTIGPFITRAEGTTQTPVIQRGGASIVTGIAGATFTSIVERTANNPTPSPTPTTWSGSRYALSSVQFGKESIFVSKNPTEIYQSNPSLDFDRLTDGSSNDSLPAWSPDAKQIVFVSDRNGNSEIYAMNSDGTNVRRLTDNAAVDTEPVWSPDGTKIAFVSRRSGNSDIFLMNTNGTGATNLTNNAGEDRNPVWSPDGKALFFSSNRSGTYDIWRIHTDGSQLRNLSATADANEFEPGVPNIGNILSGFSVVYIRQSPTPGSFRQMWTMDSQGQDQQAITGFPGEANYFRPQWANQLSNSSFNTPLLYLTDYQNGQYAAYLNNLLSPSGTRLIADGARSVSLSPLHSLPVFPPTPTPLPTPGATVRTLIGSGGRVASACAGFLYGMAGTWDAAFSSFVSVDTASGARQDMRINSVLSDETGTNGILLFSVTAGTSNITSLRYLNKRENNVIYAIGGNDSGPVAGALIYFNPVSGEVVTVLPYNATKAVGGAPTVTRQDDSVLLRGRFTGAFDRTGANLAPNGVTEVRIDRKTGKVTLSPVTP